MKYILSLFLILLGSNLYAAPKLDLALCMDSSGSVSAADFLLQLNGTAASIEDPSIVPQNGTVRITVLQFGSAVTVEVAPTIITAGNAATVATAVRAIAKSGGGTNMSGCIDLATTTIMAAAPASTKQVIDLSTDGQPNNAANTTASATAAAAAGVDALNALLVGGGTNPAFMGGLVFPQPNGGNNGFSKEIANFSEYETAITKKIRAEVAPGGSQAIPTLSEWGMFALIFLLILVSLKSTRIRAKN